MRRHAESHRPLAAREPGLRRTRRLVGADRGGNWYGFYEGLYDRVYRVSQPGDPGYAELVADICAREKIDAAVVAPEAEVLFWSGREFPVPTLLPPPGLVEIAISKGKLYEALRETGLVPRYRIATREELLERRGLDLDGGPVWLRDYSEASSSGIGAIQVTEPEEAYAWALPQLPRSRATWSPSICRAGTSPARSSSTRTSCSRPGATSGSSTSWGISPRRE